MNRTTGMRSAAGTLVSSAAARPAIRVARLGVLAVIAVALGLVLFPTAKASAAGEMGKFNGSIVYCAEHFGYSSLDVEAQISRYSGFSWQWVAYSHRLRNVDTNQITQLYDADNSAWHMFKDTHNLYSTPYATGQNLHWDNPVPSGRYRIETRYAWYSGYWVYSNWINASYTNNYGWGASTPCLL